MQKAKNEAWPAPRRGSSVITIIVKRRSFRQRYERHNHFIITFVPYTMQARSSPSTMQSVYLRLPRNDRPAGSDLPIGRPERQCGQNRLCDYGIDFIFRKAAFTSHGVLSRWFAGPLGGMDQGTPFGIGSRGREDDGRMRRRRRARREEGWE